MFSFSRGRQKGFTLVELLLVVAIIGILASISVGVLSVARAKSRDAKRVSDVQVIRVALEQFWLRNAAFPFVTPAVNIGTGNYVVLCSNSGTAFYASSCVGDLLLRVPAGARSGEFYQYQSTVSTGYALRFVTEQVSIFGPAGVYYSHANGSMDADPSSK